MKFDDMFPGKFLKAADLNGHPVKVNIEKVELQDVVGQGKEQDYKWVLYFQGKQKGLILNKTNGRAITDVYEDTEAWPWKDVRSG